MAARIESLTPEQTAQLGPWRDKWIKIGLSTEPADRPTAEQALRACYKFAGLDGDNLEIVWVASPDALVELAEKWPDIRTSFSAAYHGGQFWCAWPAFETFLREVCGVEYPGDLAERTKAYADLVSATGPMLMFERLAVCLERPAEIHLVEDRLHAEGKPAVLWRDGTGIYAWRGTTVPEARYVCDPVTAEWIRQESNVELRRILIERLGLGNYLKAVEATTVHEDRFGRLVELPVDAQETALAVVVKCPSSGRDYVLGVHPEVRPLLGPGRFGEPQKRTAKNAVAASFGLRGEEYAPAVET